MLARLGAYARTASEGGTYCPDCIWLTFRIWIPRMLRVGKVGIKVNLKQPLYWVQDLCYRT